jgi:hypothetical protein
MSTELTVIGDLEVAPYRYGSIPELARDTTLPVIRQLNQISSRDTNTIICQLVAAMAMSINVERNLNELQVRDIASEISSRYDHLTLNDIAICTKMIKNGELIKIYNRLDTPMFFDALHLYLDKKTQEQRDYEKACIQTEQAQIFEKIAERLEPDRIGSKKVKKEISKMFANTFHQFIIEVLSFVLMRDQIGDVEKLAVQVEKKYALSITHSRLIINTCVSHMARHGIQKPSRVHYDSVIADTEFREVCGRVLAKHPERWKNTESIDTANLILNIMTKK